MQQNNFEFIILARNYEDFLSILFFVEAKDSGIVQGSIF